MYLCDDYGQLDYGINSMILKYSASKQPLILTVFVY